MESCAAAKNSVAASPVPVRVPNLRPFSPSVTLVTSVANYKDDNEMIPGAVHRSPGIYLTAEENPGESQETVDDSCATSHRLNVVGRIAQHVRKG